MNEEPLTPDTLDAQQADIWREPAPLWGKDDRSDRWQALEKQRPAAQERARTVHLAYMAGLAAAGSSTASHSPVAPETLDALDAQVEAIEAKERKIDQRLKSGWLESGEQMRLIDEKLDLNTRRTSLLQQREGLEQAAETAHAPQEFRRQVEHLGFQGAALDRATDLHALALDEGIGGTVVLDAVIATRDAEAELAALGQAGEPRPTPESAESIWQAAWGSRFEDRLESASVAWDLLEAKRPALAKEVTASGLRYTLRFANIMADLGAALLDPKSDRGYARRVALLSEPE